MILVFYISPKEQSIYPATTRFLDCNELRTRNINRLLNAIFCICQTLDLQNPTTSSRSS